MIVTGEYQRTWRKTCPIVTLYTLSSTWTDTCSNSGLETNRLSHATAYKNRNIGLFSNLHWNSAFECIQHDSFITISPSL
jgi:hypothetical protein